MAVSLAQDDEVKINYINVRALPTASESEIKDVYFYPNPSDGNINFNFGTHHYQEANARLFNFSGKLLYEMKITGDGKISFSNERLGNDFYFLELKLDDRIIK